MLVKPIDKIIWANTDVVGPKYSQDNKIEPTTEKVNTGFLEDEIPPRNHFNWLFNNIHLWIDFLDEFVKVGSGSPEGVITGDIGNIYLNTDGGAGTTLYVKESGAGNTGWVGK
jgi:hypothetical protein